MEQDLLETVPSPPTVGYASHLAQTAYSGGAGEIAAAILPGSWGSCEIGQMLFDRGLPMDQPLYTQWIQMYNSPGFTELADWLRAFVDAVGAVGGQQEIRNMEEAFLTSSRYAYMFWDAAYRMEQWAV